VLDENNIVHFHNVEIITDDADGVWVTGLPNETTLITVGQEMVVAGERVDPDLQNMPSSVLARSLTADAQTSR
jgi:multidrug efflux system membrane fusion protein